MRVGVVECKTVDCPLGRITLIALVPGPELPVPAVTRPVHIDTEAMIVQVALTGLALEDAPLAQIRKAEGSVTLARPSVELEWVLVVGECR